MKLLLTAFLFSIASVVSAQTFPLTGEVFGEDGIPLVYSSVVLLDNADSTMHFFGITNNDGHFEIKNCKPGDYLLQASFLGYELFYRDVTIPVKNNSIGTIVLKTKNVNVGEVKVAGEYVPIAIKNDTVEYNAKAFKLKPDAVTEDLLKKLPGVEVDRSGNIKAMGEDVKKLYVDGKEFFGNDPKVATKNVPADAVDKVQLYDRKSEEAMFTGIDDGVRDKAINLELKEDKKNALFGNIMAGGGTNEHWQGSAKAYRFSDRIQLAALGMGNNVNQFGFSFNDYMNFSGGVGKMIHGGGSAEIKITSDGSFPINFGQPVSGLNTSGAGGANFSYSKNQFNRTFISYLANGSKKELEERTKTWNYTNEKDYFQDQELNETDKNAMHSFNFGLRRRIDSTQNILLDGNFSFSNGDNDRFSFNESTTENRKVNSLENQTSFISDQLSGNAGASYTKKLNHGKSVIKASGNFSLTTSNTDNLIQTYTKYFDTNENVSRNVFQDNSEERLNYSGGITFTQKIGNGLYLTPDIRAGNVTEELDRLQGVFNPGRIEESQFSPQFQKVYSWIAPKISLKKTAEKSSFSVSLKAENGNLKNTLNNSEYSKNTYLYFLPAFWYEYKFQTGRRLMFDYRSNVNTPNNTQLLPVENNINPLSVFVGNPELKPELNHNVNTHFIFFDQFSFTSLMVNVNGTYTKDKINWTRMVDNQLVLRNSLKNFDYHYNIGGNVNFSTPIRKLGIKTQINLSEDWNRGLSLVNNVENEYSAKSHRASIQFENRKKEKWDLVTGIEVALTNSNYSVQESLNNEYFDISWFGDIRFNPNDKWNFEINSDITNYSDQSFNESVSIPLIGAEISHYFLKNKRGTLSLKGYDLLNKNQIIQRFGELNYLREIRSNSIGRFVMLSFTYRLNKFGESPGGIDIKLSR